ncbi:hypothetical protein OPT61_g9916 [Boeremia exigua]|uniref:Uncharacterized protein n=1 Tax=Boeremia exigua TaxID=749465 RepID=A0ACC2HSR1_9PLEO|nr:hypothetical protein OPT61_g9916 [Boeremia exigua]
MPQSLPATVDTTNDSHPKMHKIADDSLTWQQQQDFRGEKPKRGRRKLYRKPPSESAEATATKPASTAKPSELGLLSAQSKTPGKAHTSKLPLHGKQSAPAGTAPLPQGQGNALKKTRTNRTRGRYNSERKTVKMTAQHPGASLPPHKRKLAAAAAAAAKAKLDVKLGDSIAGATPPASVHSQAGKPVQQQALLDKAVAKDSTPISPPTSVEAPKKLADDFAGWDTPLPAQTAFPSKGKGKNPRWPRIPRSPKQKHVWLKSRDIPRHLPSDSQSDGGVTFKSHSDGDPTYDVKKLMDWNGDWLPPPEEWAARKGFTNRHFGQVIEQWANSHSKYCTNAMNIDVSAFMGVQTADGTWLNKELVPRYWLHDTIDNAAPRKFWEELPQRAPAPFSDIDITEDPPYWERWEDGQPEDCFMATLVVPEARIDINDNDNELESPFAMLPTNDRVQRIMEVRKNRRLREEARQARPVTVCAHEGVQLPDRRLRPKANIFLRPVQPTDVHGIMTIYNYYIANTVEATELEEQTEAQIRTWIDDLVQANLPCLVAVAKRNQRKNPQGYVNDTIVGFIHLEEYAAPPSMYRFTFELALYVHPGYIRQGVGRCLLDQMMDMVNTGYKKKGGFEWVHEVEYLKNGKSRTVKTIVVDYHYERGSDVAWLTSYLGDFGFTRAGRFAQIGHKIGKVVDKVVYQVNTTEVIDPNTIPMIQA